jgi:hypothetical protein
MHCNIPWNPTIPSLLFYQSVETTRNSLIIELTHFNIINTKPRTGHNPATAQVNFTSLWQTVSSYLLLLFGHPSGHSPTRILYASSHSEATVSLDLHRWQTEGCETLFLTTEQLNGCTCLDTVTYWGCDYWRGLDWMIGFIAYILNL